MQKNIAMIVIAGAVMGPCAGFAATVAPCPAGGTESEAVASVTAPEGREAMGALPLCAAKRPTGAGFPVATVFGLGSGGVLAALLCMSGANSTTSTITTQN